MSEGPEEACGIFLGLIEWIGLVPAFSKCFMSICPVSNSLQDAGTTVVPKTQALPWRTSWSTLGSGCPDSQSYICVDVSPPPEASPSLPWHYCLSTSWQGSSYWWSGWEQMMMIYQCCYWPPLQQRPTLCACSSPEPYNSFSLPVFPPDGSCHHLAALFELRLGTTQVWFIVHSSNELRGMGSRERWQHWFWTRAAACLPLFPSPNLLD